MGYVPKDSHEQLLLSVLQDKCPIPPQLRKELVRLYFGLKDLEKARRAQIAALDKEIQSLCEWLESPYESTDLGLSEVSIAQKQKKLAALREEQIAKVDIVYDKKLKLAQEYCQALNEITRLQKVVHRDASKLEKIYDLDFIISDLRPKYEASASIRALIKERHELIQQMKAFEVSASDPARLFQPSFRLLQEEKFRKSAIPNLLRLEGRLRDALGKWDGKFGCEGEEDWGGMMEEEIATRYVNETVFGFSQQEAPRSGAKSVVPKGTTQKSSTANSSKELPTKRLNATK